ncbi:MAG: hypothetical protein RL685_464 [Pseudomonadota bacterium]|jgi:hypothetical protein
MSELPGWFEEWRERAGDRWWWPLGGVALLAVGLAVWGLSGSSTSGDEPTAAAPAESPSAAPATPAAPEVARPPSSGTTPLIPPVPPPAVPSATAVDAGAPPSPNVKLTFRTFPARPSVVMWGSKKLGIIDRNKPLVVERPRDSGPVDVIIRSTGFVPVHTRAYTFTDGNIDVRITPLEKKDTIYGYKEPILDAGVPFPGEPIDMP